MEKFLFIWFCVNGCLAIVCLTGLIFNVLFTIPFFQQFGTVVIWSTVIQLITNYFYKKTINKSK